MTSTTAAVSRKCTSASSTSRCRPNARRARKLGAKSRRTNCSNIFRWYRSGWSRYTQPDPLGRAGNVYAYANGNPIGLVDPLGLAPKLNNLTCCELASEITRLSDQLKYRYFDELRIQRALLTGGLVRLLATSITAYWGHYVQYRQRQKQLQRYLDEYNDRCGPPMSKSVSAWANKAFPDDDYLWDLWIAVAKTFPNGTGVPVPPPPFGLGEGLPIPIE